MLRIKVIFLLGWCYPYFYPCQHSCE